MYTARFVVDDELDQPLGSIAIFPQDFWQKSVKGDIGNTELSLVAFAKPISIDSVLNELARVDPQTLGLTSSVPLYQHGVAGNYLADKSMLTQEPLHPATMPVVSK